MTERVRRRTSKWDLKEDPDSYAVEARQENVISGKASEFIHDNGSKRERNSSKNNGTRISKWSDNNPHRGSKSEANSGWSRWDTPSGNRDEQKDNYVSRDFNEVSQSRKKWDGDRSYSTSLSPGRDDWRQRSRSRSPRSRWSKSHRSRSRSRSRSPAHDFRSRSITPPHGLRSRSRSPPYGLKRGYNEWDNRIRGGSGVSAPPCNDFAMGRCRRGSECRFLHQENNESEGRRNPGGVPAEYWGSRHERGGSYGHLNNVERDYSRDKLSHEHESQRNNRSSDQCVSFLRGKCHRGSSCTYIHDDSIADGRGTGERIHEWDTDVYSGRDHRRDPPSNNITLCKFFASGNCRKGISGRFSHEGEVLDKPEGRSADQRGHNLGDENKTWGGPKWGDEEPVTTRGNVEGSSLDGSGRVQGNGWGDQRYNYKPVVSTWDDEAANDVLQGRSADVKRQNSFGYENKSGRGSKGSDEVGDSAHHTVGGRPLNEWSTRIGDSGPDDRYKHKPCWS